MVLLKFLAQGTAVDAEARGRPGLVVVTMVEYSFQHRLLDFRHHRFKQVAGYLAVQVIQVFSNRLFYRLLQQTCVFLDRHTL